MSTAIDARDAAGTLSARLLADREQLALSAATEYLVTRAREATPLGAAEFLAMRGLYESPEAYSARVDLTATLCSLYRELFGREYSASGFPPFSIQREHEFYRLVNNKLFPLCVDTERPDTTLDRHIEQNPLFFLPVIPVAGTQQHDWERGCCPFETLQTVFRLALVLSGRRPDGTDALGVEGLPEAAPPVAAFGWSGFRYACLVSGTPLRSLPAAIHMTCYRTGNPWLDASRGEMTAAIKWSGRAIAQLLVARRQAEELNAEVLELNRWLVESPRERLGLAVRMWNDAAELEQREGMAGVYVADRDGRVVTRL